MASVPDALPGPSGSDWSRLPLGASAVLGFLLVLPFTTSIVPPSRATGEPPPGGTMSQRLDGTSHKVRLVGQPQGIELFWFEPSSDDRHHSLPMCMRYRGVTLRTVNDQGVMTDGSRWLREFFVQDGNLILGYTSYLARTFVPFSSPGAHVIASIPKEVMSAEAFASTSEELAHELQRLSSARR